MIKILADALVPIFAGLLLGYVAGLRGVMDNKNVQTLITLVMSFAVPCALFLSIISAPRAALREEIPSALVFTLGYTVVYALSFLWTTYGMNLHASDSSVVALTVAFPNSAAVGLPLLASVFGSQATVTVAASLAIGSITITPITLAILEANRGGPGGGHAEPRRDVATSLFEEAYCLGSASGVGSVHCRFDFSFVRGSIVARHRDGG